jgi:hypothetical protein
MDEWRTFQVGFWTLKRREAHHFGLRGCFGQGRHKIQAEWHAI